MKAGFEDEFLHRIGKIVKQWGLGEPAGRVWGVLLFNSKPLTQREIAKQCKYSLGLVSPSLKILESLGMISTASNKGKEKQYNAIISPIASFGQMIRNSMENDVRPLISLLESNVKNVKDNEIGKRLKLIINDHKKIEILLNFFSKYIDTKKLLSVDQFKREVNFVL